MVVKRSMRSTFWIAVWCIVLLLACFGLLESPLVTEIFTR